MIESEIEDFELMILIKSGNVHIIGRRGKRNADENFKDIEEKLSAWFKKKTCLPGREGTNYQSALDEYECCNA